MRYGFFAKFVVAIEAFYIIGTTAGNMKRDFIDLLDFQTKMKTGVECLFPDRFWLRAEVSAVKSRP